MNVVYAGLRGGSCAVRWELLRRKFEDGVYIEYDDYLFKRGRLKNALENWAYAGPGVRRLNEVVLEKVTRLRPEVVWLDRAIWIQPETLEKVRAMGAVLVHHTSDCLDPRHWLVRWTMRQLRRSIGQYDLALTTNEHDLAWMRAAGVNCAETMMAADGARFNARPIPDNVRARWAADVLFVGHYEPSNASAVATLVRAGVPITVYGTGARQRGRRGLAGG
jgi:spore maturation protein CgeB